MTINKLLDSEIFFIILLFIGSMCFLFPTIIKLVFEKINAKKHIETVRVKIVSKRKIWGVYGVLVELETGERREFDLSLFNANVKEPLLLENDIGILTYQGSMIIKFERDIVEKEKT